MTEPISEPATDLALVEGAAAGERDAVEQVIRRVQEPVYRLALRMTGRPPDAEDATQEILIRVLTRLASFRGEATLVTWAYRIAVNHLINLRRRSAHEQRNISFDSYRADLLAGLATPEYTGPDGELLAEEIRLNCTQALVQCLDRTARATYVLGEIVGLSSPDAAWVLGIRPAAYRKRLERARQQVREALRGRCGLLDSAAPCRCERRITYAMGQGRVSPDRLLLTGHATTETRAAAVDLHQLRDVGELLRIHPAYAAPAARTAAVLQLVRSGRFANLLPAGQAGAQHATNE